MRISNAKTSPSDVAYAAVYAGAIGGATVALFFLARDIAIGAPLATPSMLGSALFLGAEPSWAAEVRLDMVALFSLVHLVMFAMVGALFAFVLGRVEELRHRPLALGAGVFATLTAGIAVLDVLALPGVVSAINPVALATGNALAATLMTRFYLYAFEEMAAPVHATD